MNEREREEQLDRLLVSAERVLHLLCRFLERLDEKPKTYPQTTDVKISIE